jgi:uncharacterized protein (DUF885 family)
MSAVEAFADDLLFDMFALSPDLAAELGVTEVNGRTLSNTTLPDCSDAAAAARRALMDERYDRFSAFAATDLAGDEAVTAKVVGYLMKEGAFGPFAGREGRSFLETPYPANHLSGWHPATVDLLVRDHAVGDAEDAEAYLVRLNAIPPAIETLKATLAARQAEGVRAPRTIMSKALADLRAFAAPSPADNVLVGSFRDKLAARSDIDGASFVARAERIVETQVRPAYEGLIEAVEDACAQADGDMGFWRLPDGEAWYAWALRRQTTTRLTPQAVHELGLQEIERVQAEIRREFSALGVEAPSVSALYAAISGGAHQAFGGSTDRAHALAETKALMASLEERSRPLFERLPRAGVEVELIPPEGEESQHSHYTPPSPGRPGRFSLNVKSALERPGWEVAVLCAHEATPGHHTQLALAQELPLSAFRRAVIFTSYIEGWAKYAETLLDRHLMDDPHVRLGRLRGELYSTVNLVLDTGVHWKRWTREEACSFFQEETGAPRALAESVADRSLVWPGQLCAYKIGMLKMLEIRDRFDAREEPARMRRFHAAVLERGALPLGVLDEITARGTERGRLKETQ